MTRKCTKKWTTASGEKIRVCDMTSRHLENTVRMLKRNAAQVRQQTIEGLVDMDTFITGEMASMDIDRRLNAALQSTDEDYLPEIYWDMTNELERRKGKHDG